MAETISKHIGEGFGKGELSAALAYDAADAFGGMKIKNVMFDTTGKAYFYDADMYIGASADGALVIASDTSITLEAPTVNVSVTASSAFTDPVTITYNCVAAAVSDLTITSVSSDATGGSTVIKPLYVNATMSGSGGLGRAIEGKLLVSGKLGTYGNAIKGYIDFTGGSGCVGLASAICAEMKMPLGTALGTFGVLELELVTPASGWTAGTGTGTNCISWIYAEVSGTLKTQFNEYGYIFNLQGLTSSTTDLLYNNTLKCAIGSTKWYIPLSSAEGSFTTAYPIVTTYATTAISIATCTTGISIVAATTGIALTGQMTTGIYMEPSAITSGLLIGAASTSAGSGLRMGTGTTVPVGIYFDDGGVAITAWGECFTVGSVYTAASSAQGQTGMPYTAFFYNDVRAAMNGAASAGWSTVMTSFCMTGALAGFEVGVSSLHTSVDLNATSSLSEETTLSCISFGGNWIAGTYDASTDGLIVPLNVRPTNQNWSAFLHLPASANGCYEAYAGEGTGAYSIKVYVGSTATWIHTYNQA